MYDVTREDKPIIQSIALIDQLDKNINSFIMRIKEWYSWHFPELSKVVTDSYAYVKVVTAIEVKIIIKSRKEKIFQLKISLKLLKK